MYPEENHYSENVDQFFVSAQNNFASHTLGDINKSMTKI